MRKLTFAITLFACSAFAGEWTGFISDSHCGAKHTDASGAACIQKCIKGGAKAVFVTSDNKVLEISNPAKVAKLEGQKVTVKGDLAGDTLTIKSAKAAM
jgi:hypothetical protein